MDTLKNTAFDNLLSTENGKVKLFQELINGNNSFLPDQVKKIYASALLNLSIFEHIVYIENVTDVKKYSYIKKIYNSFKQGHTDSLEEPIKHLFNINDLDTCFIHYVLYLQKETIFELSGKNRAQALKNSMINRDRRYIPIAFLRSSEFYLDEHEFLDFMCEITYGDLEIYNENNILYRRINVDQYGYDITYEETLYSNLLMTFENYTKIGIDEDVTKIETEEMQLTKNQDSYGIISKELWVKTDYMPHRINNGNTCKYRKELVVNNHNIFDRYKICELILHPNYKDDELIFLNNQYI